MKNRMAPICAPEESPNKGSDDARSSRVPPSPIPLVGRKGPRAVLGKIPRSPPRPNTGHRNHRDSQTTRPPYFPETTVKQRSEQSRSPPPERRLSHRAVKQATSDDNTRHPVSDISRGSARGAWSEPAPLRRRAVADQRSSARGCGRDGLVFRREEPRDDPTIHPNPRRHSASLCGLREGGMDRTVDSHLGRPMPELRHPRLVSTGRSNASAPRPAFEAVKGSASSRVGEQSDGEADCRAQGLQLRRRESLGTQRTEGHAECGDRRNVGGNPRKPRRVATGPNHVSGHLRSDEVRVPFGRPPIRPFEAIKWRVRPTLRSALAVTLPPAGPLPSFPLCEALSWVVALR